MNYKDHVNNYGYVDTKADGAWVTAFTACLKCKEELQIEVDLESSGGALKDIEVCSKCGEKFKIAYRQELVIHIEPFIFK